RILEEIREHLGEVIGIGQRSQTRRYAYIESDRSTLERGRGEIDRRRDGTIDVDLLDPGGPSVGTALGQEIEGAREANEPVHLFAQRGEGLPARRHDTVAERLEVALQVRQRRPQLVGGVGDEVRALACVFLEPLRHLIERAGQRDHLLWTLRGNANAEVA